MSLLSKQLSVTLGVTASLLVVPFMSSAATAVIGVAKFDPSTSANSNFYTGELGFYNAAGELQSSTTLVDTEYSTQRVYGNIHSTTGLETISYYDEYNYNTVFNSVVMIADQAGNILDTFHPFGEDQTKAAVLTVGDLTAEYSGPEIAVCRSHTTLPQVKIYHYSETDGAEEISSFYPFGEESTKVRGCNSLVIGDVDGDSVAEIIVSKKPTKKVKIFDSNGTLKYDLMLSNVFGRPVDTSTIKLIYNPETKENNIVVLHIYKEYVYVVDTELNLLSTLRWSDITDKSLKQLIVGDVDQDGVEELIALQRGTKGKVHILNQTGTEHSVFTTDPEETNKHKRQLYFEAFVY